MEQYLLRQAIPLKPFTGQKRNSNTQRTLTTERNTTSRSQQKQLLAVVASDPYLKRQEIAKLGSQQAVKPASRNKPRLAASTHRQTSSPKRRNRTPSSDVSILSQLPIIPETGDASIALTTSANRRILLAEEM